VLGAGGWQTFWRVTLRTSMGLLYGSSCATRAMGEFGAVSVVSGKIAAGPIPCPSI